MRRLARHLFTLCSAVSLLLCVAACVLWLRSYIGTCVAYIAHEVSGRELCARGCSLVCDSGYLNFLGGTFRERFEDDAALGLAAAQCEAPAGLSITSGPDLDIVTLPNPISDLQPDVRWSWWRVFYQCSRYVAEDDEGRETGRYTYWQVGSPAWLPVLLLSILPGVQSVRLLRRGLTARRRGRAGLCPSCGYDLRASPGRCPECGAAAPAGGMIAAMPRLAGRILDALSSLLVYSPARRAMAASFLAGCVPAFVLFGHLFNNGAAAPGLFGIYLLICGCGVACAWIGARADDGVMGELFVLGYAAPFAGSPRLSSGRANRCGEISGWGCGHR